jgi:hypothetical protein
MQRNGQPNDGDIEPMDHLGFQAPPCPAHPPTGPPQIVSLPQLDIQKQGVGQFALRSINLLILLGIKRLLPEVWEESFILPIHKKCDKTDCSNYRSISLLSTTYKILSNVLLARLTPYLDEITGDHQRGFRRSNSTTDPTYCICQILEKKMGTQCSSASAIIDFQKARDSISRERVYNILTEFGILMKLLRLSKMCLNEMYSRVQVGKDFSDMFPISNGLKRDALSPLLYSFTLVYAIRRA